uniref:PORR domain-containing protein n=2 Tax=Chenopodium quinoa TaxID=63459 RepID=A0A803MX81_CHEQI
MMKCFLIQSFSKLTMLQNSHKAITFFNTLIPPKIPPNSISRVWNLLQCASFCNLKVHWRKDEKLDESIRADKKWRLCARIVKEVLNEPGQVMPLRYLEKRRERLKLNVTTKVFIDQNPLLFDTYFDRIRPKSDSVTFIKPSESLRRFLEEEERIYAENELLIVSKICKMLMMAKNRVINVEKLVHVKREFGFPNDFLSKLVPKYSNYFKLVGGFDENSYLELVSWEPEFAKSVIMLKAEEEERLTGIRVRPSFDWKLPPGFYIKKGMREWVRDWMEMPYINPYDDASHLDSSSREMEKRMVGVLHELLSLSLFKRIPVPILGKFSEDYRLSNAFSSVFTRHSGIFYMSLKGGIETAVLREAYKGGVLVDRDPLLEIKDKFVELLEEGWEMRMEELRLRRESARNRNKSVTLGSSELESQEDDDHL